jgi:DHA1 family tetracycline resistance protein-like MFS transporter
MNTTDKTTATTATTAASPGTRGTLIILAITVFLNIAGFTLILPVTPFLVARYVATEMVGFYVGLIVSVFALCAFCAAPVLGSLSDHYGRRPILILSLIGSAAGYVVFGVGGALWVLFAGRIIDGLTAGNIATLYAFVADYYPPAERGRVYGFLGAVGGLGFMLGPVAGGLLGSISPAVPLFAAAAVTLISAAWVFFALPESASRKAEPFVLNWRQLNPLAQLGNVLRQAAMRIPFAAAFSFFFAGTMLQSNFAVYLNQLLQFGPTGIGWTLFGVGVMDIVSQGLLSRLLLPRLGAERVTKLGLAINAAGFALIACLLFAPTIALLGVSLFVFTLGDGLFQPAINETIANAAPADMQGAVQGANQAQQSLARMVGPLLAAVLSPFNLSAPYWVACAVVVAGLAVLSMSSRSAQPG